MNCPICHHDENFVVRTDAEQDTIRRRRQCRRCGHRWTTYETAADVIAKFDRLKQVLAPVAELMK